MKILIAVRHAETQPSNQGLADKERSLTLKGRKDVALTAQIIKNRGFMPEKIICSGAVRACQSAEIFADVFGISFTDIVIDNMLYEYYDDTQFAAMLEEWTPGNQCVIVVAHNPLLPEMIFRFTGKNIGHFSPASAAIIMFKVDKWQKILKKQGELIFYHTV